MLKSEWDGIETITISKNVIKIIIKLTRSDMTYGSC